MLEQGHFELVEFSWKAKEVSKDHNISFNVSFENAQNLSFEQLWDNNYRSQKLEVLAPTPWIDTPCLIAIVIIVIIVIIIIIYFYRRRREEYGDIGKRRKEKDKGKSKGKGKSKSKGMEKEKSKQKKKGKKKD